MKEIFFIILVMIFSVGCDSASKGAATNSSSSSIASSTSSSTSSAASSSSAMISDINPVCEQIRSDGACKVYENLLYSAQNPAWSPDDTQLLITEFIRGYNRGASNLMLLTVNNTLVSSLYADGNVNVNLPGTVWSRADHTIVFSSTKNGHDEIFTIHETGSHLTQITSRNDKMAFEPSFSPDGSWLVFESHKSNQDDNGVITKYRLDGTSNYTELTPLSWDCRQPNWSPVSQEILIQCYDGSQWDLWNVNATNGVMKQLTQSEGDETDASYSPDGQSIVFSGSRSDIAYAEIFIMNALGTSQSQLTDSKAYNGAPAWSHNGEYIAFEASDNDPKLGGTAIWMIAVKD